MYQLQLKAEIEALFMAVKINDSGRISNLQGTRRKTLGLRPRQRVMLPPSQHLSTIATKLLASRATAEPSGSVSLTDYGNEVEEF